YSPEPQSAASIPEQSSAEILQIQNEMNGTGAAPALVKGRGKAASDRDSRTRAMAAPPAAPSSRGALYGVLAFLLIAVGGGAAGYWFFFHQDEPPPAPVAVERATLAETEPPAKPAQAVKPAETAPAEPEKPATPASKPAETKARPHKIAQVET